jgi:hypothetical protein
MAHEKEQEEKLIDLMQYVTNMVYHARTQADEMTSTEFEEWVEEHIKGIKEYFLSTQPEEKEDDNKVYDCSSISDEEKEFTIKQFTEMTGKAAMKLFYMLGLKTHIEARLMNDPTKEEFIFIFRKI